MLAEKRKDDGGNREEKDDPHASKNPTIDTNKTRGRRQIPK